MKMGVKGTLRLVVAWGRVRRVSEQWSVPSQIFFSYSCPLRCLIFSRFSVIRTSASKKFGQLFNYGNTFVFTYTLGVCSKHSCRSLNTSIILRPGLEQRFIILFIFSLIHWLVSFFSHRSQSRLVFPFRFVHIFMIYYKFYDTDTQREWMGQSERREIHQELSERQSLIWTSFASFPFYSFEFDGDSNGNVWITRGERSLIRCSSGYEFCLWN